MTSPRDTGAHHPGPPDEGASRVRHVLVTGSDGFIGRELSRTLRREGRLVTELGVDIDIRDRELVSRIIAEARPDAVVHLAAVSGPMLLRDDPAEVTAVNAVGTVNVFEAARLANVKRVVYASSIGVIEISGARRTPPLSIYGATKQFGETVAGLYRDLHGLDSTSARIGSVYGIERATEHVLNDMIAAAACSRQIPYDTHAVEALIEVRDAARLLAGILSVRRLRDSYDLVTDVKTHRELAQIVAELTGCVARPNAQSRSTAISWSRHPDLHTVLDDTGLQAAVPIRAGIAHLLEGLRAAGARTPRDAGPVPGRCLPY